MTAVRVLYWLLVAVACLANYWIVATPTVAERIVRGGL